MLHGAAAGGGRERPQSQSGQPQQNQWTWERFCREEARETASAFLERVRRFKSRHASTRDVHDSTFTNEFSAAFLEESSILMANAGETILPTTNVFSTSLPAGTLHSVGREETRRATKPSGKASWWNGLFKWSGRSKRSGERHSSGSSTSSSSQSVPSRTPGGNSRMHSGGSTKQKKRGIRVVKETALVQLLNLSECEEGDANWSPCRLLLVQQQDNYQIEIYSPPKNPMPKMSLFCFLLEEVRSTTSLEIPDSNSCFAIKSQNHGEYVFDVKKVELKEEWVLLLQAYTNKNPAASNGHLPRSSQASSHLATLPRAPSSSPHSSPLRSRDNNRVGVPPTLSLDTSPLLVSRTQNLPSREARQPSQPSTGANGSEPGGRHLSLSDPRKMSVLNTSVTPGDSEESVLVDMSSFMRNYSVTRSPNRRRKTMSMFVEPSTHITSTPNPYVEAHGVNVLASPPASHAPVLESPARFPYGSPQGSPPPLPKREHRPRSMFIKNSNITKPRASTIATSTGITPLHTLPNNDIEPHSPTGGRPLPASPTSPYSATPTSPYSATTPTGARPLPNEAAPVLPSRKPMNGHIERKLPPRRKMSQPLLELPSSPCAVGNTLHDLPSPGILETCSQSSSTAALHPVSILALSKKRKSSIPLTPTEGGSGAFQLLTVQAGGNGVWRTGKERVRKVSAPVPGSPSYVASPSCVADFSESEATHVEVQGLEEGQGDEMASPSSPDKPVFSASPIAFDLYRGFCPGEEQTDHATLSFPHFSQHSSAPEAQGSPGIELAVEKNQGHLSGTNISHHLGNRKHQTPPIPNNDRQLRTPPTPNSDRPPIPNSDRPPIPNSDRPPIPSNDRQLQTPPIPTKDRPLQTPPIPSSDRPLRTPPTPNSDRQPHTPPSTSADFTHSLSREGATSRNSNLTSASTHSISSLDDRDSSIRAESSTSNPIFVETTESQGYNQTTTHTRHPYEYWATNQQDMANLRTLSQYPWFHGMISRNNASQLVTVDGDRGTGQYLVRQSESREGDFVLTFNYHNRAKHLRMAVDSGGCNIQHLWFDSVLCMLEYFKTNSIPLESFWLNDDVKLTMYIDRQASDGFRTTTVLNVDQLNRAPPRRSRSLHLGMSRSVAASSGVSSHPGTPSLATGESASTNSLPFTQGPLASSGWRQIFRSQRSSSAGNVGRVQRSHSHNAGSIQSTGRGSGGSGTPTQHSNAYVWRNY